ncbi:hypothetical protein ONO86_03032 [Micromonospora noduli]|nr:hypothetical protein ONO86_03032 [Micromonospora noduli]
MSSSPTATSTMPKYITGDPPDDSAAVAVVFGAAETPPCAAGFTASSTVATSVGLGVGDGVFDRDGVGDGVTRPPVSRAASVA